MLRKLLDLDMNVICIAREKLGSNGLPTFDGEKSLPYIFDVVLRFYVENGEYMIMCEKDRSNQLPKKPFVNDGNILSTFLKKEEKDA